MDDTEGSGMRTVYPKVNTMRTMSARPRRPHHRKAPLFLAALELYRSHQGNTIAQRARLTKIPAPKTITCTNHCPQTAKPRLRSVTLSSSACYDSYRGTHPEPCRSSLNQIARCIPIPNPAGSLNAHTRTYNMPN